MWLFWLIAAGIFFIGEMITVGFLIFWLGIGALLAMLVSFFVDNLVIQTAVFVVTSIALILLTKPLVAKYISKSETVPTNAYRILGQKGIVLQEISAEVGQVKVDGEVWSAVAENNQTIGKGTEVEVLKIDGVKLVVAPCRVSV